MGDVVTKTDKNDDADDVDVDDVDDANDDGAQDDSDNDDDGTPEVTFATKADFVKHVNGIVKKRLDREVKKYAPIVAERDTLKERVGELSGADKDKSAAEKQIEALSKQVSELLSYQATTQRTELVRNIAKEHGLPDEFLARVQGDDEDSITEDVEQLVELLKIDGKPAPKRVPKNTKPDGKDGKGGKGSDGKGGAEDDAKNDLDKIAKSIGRYGHRPISVG